MYQDADLNFTLMPAIQALLKPDEEDVPKPKKPPQTYYRRPGRGELGLEEQSRNSLVVFFDNMTLK